MNRLPRTALATLVVLVAVRAPGQDTQSVTITDASAAQAGRVRIVPAPVFPPPEAWPERELPQLPGFPITISVHGNFKPTRGAVLADLDGDGDLEILVGSTDGKLYAWDYTGSARPGFPVTLIGWAQYAPAVADLDGDGDVEIVQCTRGQTSGGRLYVLSHQGQVLPGFPRSFNNNNVESSPCVTDLDGDGLMEIIACERAYPIGRVHVVRIDGTEWTGNWPVTLDHVPAATPAAGDVDGDGQLEILAVSYNSLYLLRMDGTALPGWPKQIPSCNFSYQSGVLADLDHDGDLEIVVGAHKDAAGCYVFHHDGTTFAGWPKLLGTWTYCPPTVTDFEGDGVLEILDGRAGFLSGYSDCFWAWTASGQLRPGFPYGLSHGGGSEGPLTTADIDGDGQVEIFADHNMTSEGNGYIFGCTSQGVDLPGFPLRPRGFTYMNGATVGDVDGDGHCELAVVSYQDTTADVNLYTASGVGRPTARDWKTYHGRARRDGLYAGPGDLNCDGRVDADDVDPFVLALSLPADYASLYPNCTSLDADCNGDGAVSFDDIGTFLSLMSD